MFRKALNRFFSTPLKVSEELTPEVAIILERARLTADASEQVSLFCAVIPLVPLTQAYKIWCEADSATFKPMELADSVKAMCLVLNTLALQHENPCFNEHFLPYIYYERIIDAHEAYIENTKERFGRHECLHHMNSAFSRGYIDIASAIYHYIRSFNIKSSVEGLRPIAKGYAISCLEKAVFYLKKEPRDAEAVSSLLEIAKICSQDERSQEDSEIQRLLLAVLREIERRISGLMTGDFQLRMVVSFASLYPKTHQEEIMRICEQIDSIAPKIRLDAGIETARELKAITELQKSVSEAVSSLTL